MKTNMRTKRPAITTHEGAVARRINPIQQLRRTVMACLLWEGTFYEDGVSIAQRISEGVKLCDPKTVSAMAIEAREKMKLRHVPLLLVREMARYPVYRPLVAKTLERVIQRADELGEFLALYWKDGRCPVAKSVQKGLAAAFQKFNEYDLAKYNRDGAVKLRDVLFLSHAKPKDKAQDLLWKRLIDGKLEVPDTWEVALSSGQDKKETWERLLAEKKLGALALLRNLRNMNEVKVPNTAVKKALREMKTERVLPYRFISAARHAPHLEPDLEKVMLGCLGEFEKLTGKTAIVVDVSGSMNTGLSAKSEMTRIDAACALAIMVREVCRDCVVIAFSDGPKVIPARHGFALRDAINVSMVHGSTNTDDALALAESEGYDRIIVITDEQSHQTIRGPKGKGYFINVSVDQNGIGYGAWTHIDGWSESVLGYISSAERE